MTPIPSFLLSDEPRQTPATFGEKHTFSFIDRTIRNVARFIATAYQQGDTATQKGLLQMLDARVKVVVLIVYALIISLVRAIPTQLYFSALLLLLFLFSRVNIFTMYKKILVFSFFFGFLVFAPAALNVVTNGNVIFPIFQFQIAHQFWVYHIPAEIGITREGISVVARMYLKVFNSLSLTLLILNTTAFTEIIKSLKVFRVPDMFLLIITLTYKFVFILAHTVEETYFALKLRWWRKLKKAEAGKIVAGRITHIFRRSWMRYEETWQAMVARGYTGEVNLCYLRKITILDYLTLALFLLVGAAIVFVK